MILIIDGRKFKADVLNRYELNSRLIQQWSDLEQRSVEGNAYLSPHFILPAIKYLTPDAEVIFVFITDITGETPIVTGVGVFEHQRWTKRVPLPHFTAYRSPHSYLTGLLVDEEFLAPTVTAFFTLFRQLGRYSCGIEFMSRTNNTKLGKQFEDASSRLHIGFREYCKKQRAILIPEKLKRGHTQNRLSRKFIKNLHYSRNVLSKTGGMRWSVVRGQDIGTPCIDRFLKLEHMGWKGANGTSLLSHAHEGAFFKEMINGFVQVDRAFFTELSVKGDVIASTANLISSKMGYAFKIGWDTRFAQASPGMLNEVEFVKNAAELFPHLEYIDSGADEGSFIEKLWTDHYQLVSGFYATNALASKALSVIDYTRHFKRV